MTACAVALVDGLAAIDVSGDLGIPARGRGRREDLGLRERERRDRDGGPGEDRSQAAPHQKPNLTDVKYQRLDVTHKTTSINASVKPAVGSAHRGSEWSRTISTLATNTP